MINNSVSFGKNKASSGGVLNSVASSALNVGVTAGVGAGLGAGIGKLISLTPCKIKPQDLNFQFEDMFASAIINKETPSYLKGAGEDVLNIVKQGKKFQKRIGIATQSANKYALLLENVRAISDEEINRLINYCAKQVKVTYDEGITLTEAQSNTSSGSGNGEDGYDDPMYDEIVEFAIATGKISASLIQRKFRFGFNRAARMIDLLEARGIVGPQNGSKPREVIKKDVQDDD